MIKVVRRRRSKDLEWCLRTIVLCVCVVPLFAPSVLAEGSEPGTNEEKAGEFSLEDQYGTTHTYTFPRERTLLVTIAGQSGSDDIAPWLEALRERYGAAIDYQGVAYLEHVPYLARKLARATIKKRSKRPVLCDWEGEVKKQFRADGKAANIIVISPEGTIVCRKTGPMTDEARDKMFEALDGMTGGGKNVH